MNILVTGGAGYIGGTVATMLLRAGHQVTVLDNFCHSQRSQLPKGAELVEADIADALTVDALLATLKPDAVMHFAALIEAGESMKDPGLYFRANTSKTSRPARVHAAQRCQQARLLFHRRGLRRTQVHAHP